MKGIAGAPRQKKQFPQLYPPDLGLLADVLRCQYHFDGMAGAAVCSVQLSSSQLNPTT